MIFAIYGSGGLGREIFDVAMRRNAVDGAWDKIVFIDDFAAEGPFHGTDRLSFTSLLSAARQFECIVGVGEPSSREQLYSKLTAHSIKIGTLVDPTAIVSPTAKFEAGVVLMEHVILKSGAKICANVLLQPFSNIGHDIIVGAHSVLSPFCAPGGGVEFGQRVFVGMQACIIEGTAVGDDAIIGMGAAVFRDVPAGATVVGNPGRVTKGNEDGRVFR